MNYRLHLPVIRCLSPVSPASKSDPTLTGWGSDQVQVATHRELARPNPSPERKRVGF